MPVCVVMNIKVNDHLYKYNDYFTRSFQMLCGWPAAVVEKLFDERGT